MPHGKKSRSGNAKKKNKGGNNPKSNRNSNDRVEDENESVTREDFPDWQDNDEETSKTTTELPPFQTVYDRYKQATERFKDALFAKVPAELHQKGQVTDLMDAVDYLATTEIVIERELMRDLKLAISARRRATLYYYSTATQDTGHEHFLTVLAYCWGKLRSMTKKAGSSKKATRTTTASQPQSQPQFTQQQQSAQHEGNRFDGLAFLEDDDDDDDLEDETELPRIPTARPKVPDRLSLQELVHANDRMAAIFFLMTLDELMGHNAQQFAKLKQDYQYGKTQGYPPTTIVEQLMEATTSCNYAIQLVATLEQQLTVDFPHMNTVYRFLAVLVLPQFAQSLTELVVQQSPTKAVEFRETHAFMFLGDALEAAFRNPSDPRNPTTTLAGDFATEWQLLNSVGELEEMVKMVKYVVLLEAPLKQEVAMNQNFFAMAQQQGASRQQQQQPYSWLPHTQFIGQKRAIVQTLRLVQMIGSVLHSNKGHLVLKQGYFGRQWDEKKKRATSIQGDLDEFLMGDVLPLLSLMCHEGMLSTHLPFERELLTFFSELKAFVKNPLQPVSWALVFAVHTLQTSIMEVQGNDDVHNIGKEAKSCFETFMGQIDWAKTTFQSESGRAQHWHANMKRLSSLRWLVRPLAYPTQLVGVEREIKTMRAVWNPLCAGSFLLFVSYFVNLEGGTSMIDNFAQLRLVLHLYNALLVNGALEPGQLEVLDWLNRQFQNSKAVWEGAIPGRGQFVYRWWLTFGSTAALARQKSGETKERIIHSTPQQQMNDAAAQIGRATREQTPIEPKDLSKSYRRICMHDFAGLQGCRIAIIHLNNDENRGMRISIGMPSESMTLWMPWKRINGSWHPILSILGNYSMSSLPVSFASWKSNQR